MNGTYRLKRIEPLSLAKIAAAIYAVFGILAAFIVAGSSLIGMAVRPSGPFPSGFPVAGTFAVAVLMPFAYAAMAFVVGLISGWLYNFLAEKLGGIEIELAPPQ